MKTTQIVSKSILPICGQLIPSKFPVYNPLQSNISTTHSSHITSLHYTRQNHRRQYPQKYMSRQRRSCSVILRIYISNHNNQDKNLHNPSQCQSNTSVLHLSIQLYRKLQNTRNHKTRTKQHTHRQTIY